MKYLLLTLALLWGCGDETIINVPEHNHSCDCPYPVVDTMRVIQIVWDTSCVELTIIDTVYIPTDSGWHGKKGD